ncbi:hypothetical protein FACUT_1628 [Fusarium acutatum]|uniref:Copper-fist domain-containing protein n=1 Tax=Fusarium acutatum TaxID=78861 RepID=A0A8H4K4G4_9HYPO|nr:hypothetical protein FACUT_1628 [Fusarium acutatum]
MRTNEQGEKIACSKCRVGHRTSKCVDAPGHQDDLQVIRSAGRPGRSKTDPARAAEQREKKRKRRVEMEPEEEGAAGFQREAHTFGLQRTASAPVRGSFAAGYSQLSVPRYQNLGSFVNPPALVPSFARRSSFPPDPLRVGLPEPIRRPLEQPAYLSMGYLPAPPLPTVSAPVSASSAPVSQNVLVNQFDAMAQNLLVNNQVMGFPQVDMMAQADQGDNMMIQTSLGDLMEAGGIVPPVPSIPSPDLFPFNEEAREMVSWDGFIPEQPVQPMPAANSDVQSSGSPSFSESWNLLDLPTSDNSFTTELPAHGTLADQRASASSGEYPFFDAGPHVADPFAGGDLYDPGEESGSPVETSGGFFPFSYDFL